MSSCVGLSLVGLRLPLVVYLMFLVYMVKNYIMDIHCNIIKVEHSKDDAIQTSKPYFYYERIASKMIEEESLCQKSVVFILSHILEDRYGAGPEALGPADIVML